MRPSITTTDTLLSLLERRAPRYTSYPSAHHFGPLAAKSYAAWLGELPKEESIALYIHIPFCQQLCWFCGCHTKATLRYEPVKAYIDLLLEEFRLLMEALPHKPAVHSIHFGGGSPTIVNSEDLARLFYAIDAAVTIVPNAEISIEIDPRRLTEEKLRAYRSLGFNRVSLGVQDFDPKVQEAIHRIQPYSLVARTYEMLQKNRINDISLDMIYGLPFQSVTSIEGSIEKLLQLNPKRIAYFSYAHVPWLKKHQMLIPEKELPDTLDKTYYYLRIKELLEEKDYLSIGIDHFVKPHDTLALSFKNHTLRRNFMGYSTLPSDTIIGLGASAISHLPGGIAQNQPATHEYQKTIHASKFATIRGWTYREEDHVRRAIISQLMCYMEADIGKILRQYGYAENYFDAELAGLLPYERQGIISLHGRSIHFHSGLRMLIRLIASQFDYYAMEENHYSKIA